MVEMLEPYRVDVHAAHGVSTTASMLAEHGLVLVDAVADAKELLRVAYALSTVVPHRDSDRQG